MLESAFTLPDRPGLVLNIGVTGHRSLPEADLTILNQKFLEVFEEVLSIVTKLSIDGTSLYNEETPLVRLLSPLAEGSDRIAALMALEKGFQIQCPLPFAKDEYVKDFTTDQSKKEFFELLDKATAVFELACSSDSKSASYQNAGEIILGHSDVLVAVWDGTINNKIGGTADIVTKAIAQHIPVVWINAKNPHTILLLNDTNHSQNWQDRLLKILSQALLGHHLTAGSLAKLYFHEKNKKWDLAVFNTLFLQMFTRHGFKKVSISTSTQLKNARYSWDQLWPKQDTGTDKFKSFSERFYKPYYIWTDFLSLFYADYYRTAGLFQHLFYFFSTIGYGIGLYFAFWYEDHGDDTRSAIIVRGIGFFIQAVFLLSIIGMRRRNDQGRWHQKFTDYRIVAELLRQTIFLTQLGTNIHGLNLPSFNKDVNANWINWYYRAILRQGGLPSMLLDNKQLDHCCGVITNIVDSQVAYHTVNAEKNKGLHKKLEKFGNRVYWLALIFIVARVVFSFIHASFTEAFRNNLQDHDIEKTLNIFCLVLPALATLSHAIAEQGGFERLEQRSDAMAKELSAIKDQLPVASCTYAQLKTIAKKIASLMIMEVTDWRVFVKLKIIKNH